MENHYRSIIDGKRWNKKHVFLKENNEIIYKNEEKGEKRMMKKIVFITLAAALTYTVPVYAGAESQKNELQKERETIVITSLNGEKQEQDLEVPYDPQRIAVLDMASMDILVNLGVEERIVGSASTSLEYLQEYAENTENLGTIKEADLEAVMECEPDLIFIGGRLASSYDALSEIAPVVYLATDTEIGVVESVRKNAETVASIFGEEDQIEEKMEGFEERIETLRTKAEGKTAIIGMCTSGSFNVLGNDGRCSIIGREIGYENIGIDLESAASTHGNEASFELVAEKNPDYIFVMDRDAAIATEGAKLAQEIMENELVMETEAYKNGNVIYLANPGVWYTAEGGITALDIMLSDLENSLQ